MFVCACVCECDCCWRYFEELRVENMGTMQNPFIIISVLLLHCIVLYFSGDNTERRGMLPDQQQSAHQVEGQLLHTFHTSAAHY